MKTSNLLIILGVGGIGYYLLRKKKPQRMVYSDTTPVSTTPIVNKNVETAFTPSIPKVQPLFQPPANTTWVNPPLHINSNGTTNVSFGSSTQSKVDSNPDIALLIKNPSIKSKNNYYIDQYGNLIQAPSILFPEGIIIDSAERIAVWRKANGITI